MVKFQMQGLDCNQVFRLITSVHINNGVVGLDFTGILKIRDLRILNKT